MVVPVQDPNDPLGYDYAYSDASSCCACGGDTSPHSSDKLDEVTTDFNINIKVDGSKATANNDYHPQHAECKPEALPQNYVQYQKITKDLVGNSKEFRIENNKCDLRIIGNSNRIRIGCNHGNLQIIGNSTRLKIANNNGHIRYTGNDGRICLGSDSTQQTVDYIGSNGILKVVSATADDIKCTKATKADAAPEKKKQSTTATKSAATVVGAGASSAEAHCAPKKVKVKSASYGGSQWQHFNELFRRNSWSTSECVAEGCNGHDFSSNSKSSSSKKSEKNSKTANKACKINNSINIVNNYGNICIRNSVNVKI